MRCAGGSNRTRLPKSRLCACPAMDKPPEGDPVYIRDQALLRDGFSRLGDSRYYVNHHEIYLDGYRLRLRKVGEAVFSDRYLYVYRRWYDATGSSTSATQKDAESVGSVTRSRSAPCPTHHCCNSGRAFR